MRGALLVLTLASSGCITAATCERRMEAARRDAVRDADACRWELDTLAEPECQRNDFRPRNNWLAVWCGRASLSCIRSISEAEAACFGGPDTGLLGEG